MMPYQPFHSAAESLSYDVHVLAQRFNSGFEQVCHRLTTLQRPNARGVPFFMLRVDNAGNVSKRFSSGTFPFSNSWHLSVMECAFDFRLRPDRLLQAGDRAARRQPLFFHRADGAPSGGAASAAAATLCHRARLRNPPCLAAGLCQRHGSGKSPGHPIGVNCRLCERENCSQRAERRSPAR